MWSSEGDTNTCSKEEQNAKHWRRRIYTAQPQLGLSIALMVLMVQWL